MGTSKIGRYICNIFFGIYMDLNEPMGINISDKKRTLASIYIQV